ncbi:uncharacterized protein ColSpa_08333 [Colletotrichum spaethianum]|uniref:Uncharacterized protein n=1 Tax=Colletotrichum spaethianum TaxID=700344 RepID=A0AA37UQ57_9PEZI|nr:uncharacterized protein ColSpa_08333 [Colletotrichum spaethianum]GKT48152.1 hypothetical protein ColSpa_08333 [Colletotrichum spaethianum]
MGTYTGLDAIERHGIDNQESVDRSGRARCVAIRQQYQLHKDRKQLIPEQEEDNRDLEAEYDMKMQQALDHYNKNIRSLKLDVNYNGNVLKAKKFKKKLLRRMKDLQNERHRNKAWLSLWYDRRASCYMNVLRKEWLECSYCSGYHFWGDEVSLKTKP